MLCWIEEGFKTFLIFLLPLHYSQLSFTMWPPYSQDHTGHNLWRLLDLAKLSQNIRENKLACFLFPHIPLCTLQIFYYFCHFHSLFFWLSMNVYEWIYRHQPNPLLWSCLDVVRVIQAFLDHQDEEVSELNDSELLEVWSTPPEFIGMKDTYKTDPWSLNLWRSDPRRSHLWRSEIIIIMA